MFYQKNSRALAAPAADRGSAWQLPRTATSSRTTANKPLYSRIFGLIITCASPGAAGCPEGSYLVLRALRNLMLSSSVTQPRIDRRRRAFAICKIEYLANSSSAPKRERWRQVEGPIGSEPFLADFRSQPSLVKHGIYANFRILHSHKSIVRMRMRSIC
jgi:hypothetical protein